MKKLLMLGALTISLVACNGGKSEKKISSEQDKVFYTMGVMLGFTIMMILDVALG